jgi:hypothetical protein
MQASVGDQVIVHRRHVGEPDRDGEVLEVRGADGAPPYVVRWGDNGHESFFCPGSDATVRHLGHDAN